ncbi:hypothetical protein ACFXJ8_37780 [Nonomuraea sp. NPDC059194]|uniref:hypothetical protein n=1 Tax=Nonomuraea sp. NPDC059194 TaxID=3346764 RepID=UPI0036A424F1
MAAAMTSAPALRRAKAFGGRRDETAPTSPACPVCAGRIEQARTGRPARQGLDRQQNGQGR